MNLKSQIRRGVLGFAVFSAIGLVAVAHGDQVTEPGFSVDPGMAQCDVLTWKVQPVADRGDADEAHTDWRALLPAMFIRTRS